MANEKSIVVVGSCMVDFISYAPRIPKEGETIHGHKFVTGFGGKGANQCVAAAKLGGKTTLIARVGDDMWGEKYKSALKEYNVGIENVRITENNSTGIAQITVSDDGANQIVIVAGANTKLSAEDVKSAERSVKNADVLLCTLETPVEVAIEALKICKGISIMNGAPALANCNIKLLTLPTIFCVNETEAGIFSGVEVNSIENGKQAITSLLNKGCNSVLLTMGSEGALYADKSLPGDFHYVACPKVKAVDTTGAGDSFIGALAFLLATQTDFEMKRVMEMACFIASESVKHPGTQTSFPDKDILREIYDKNKM